MYYLSLVTLFSFQIEASADLVSINESLNSLYYVGRFSADDGQVNVDMAYEECHNRGAHLWAVNSQEEDEQVISYIKDTGNILIGRSFSESTSLPSNIH